MEATSVGMPEDGRLARVAAEVERVGWAAELYDSEWRLVFVSSNLRELVGIEDDTALGYGLHQAELGLRPERLGLVTEKGIRDLFEMDGPHLLADTPGGLEGLRERIGDAALALEGMAPAAPSEVWSGTFEWRPPDGRPTDIARMCLRLRDGEGESCGVLVLTFSALPATISAMLTRGDVRVFRRMAALVEPRRRAAGVVFADLQSSARLSRRLSTAAYFSLIRELTTRLDEVVAERGGIVGKHAGDGVTAFFLAADLGSDAAAARATIEAARQMSGAAAAAAGLAAHDVAVSPEDCLLNVAGHWGANVYIGQVVTGGRLEVTALGDEVNEAARIQQTARDGAVLASKALMERLDAEGAAALGIDPDGASYLTVADLPGASDKAVRDAGGIAVTEL